MRILFSPSKGSVHSFIIIIIIAHTHTHTHTHICTHTLMTNFLAWEDPCLTFSVLHFPVCSLSHKVGIYIIYVTIQAPALRLQRKWCRYHCRRGEDRGTPGQARPDAPGGGGGGQARHHDQDDQQPSCGGKCGGAGPLGRLARQDHV